MLSPIDADQMGDGAHYFDVSSLTYDDFLLYFFTNPTAEKWDEDDKGEPYWLSKINHPEIVVRYLNRLFVGFAEFAKRLPIEVVDEGLTGMFSPAYLQLQTVLWNPAVSLQERLECVRSMYRVFADFVAPCKCEVLPGAFYMWWDHICTAFWFDRTPESPESPPSYAHLGENDKMLVDVFFETLCEILDLPDDRTKGCALHGLGHLHHPKVQQLVQRFIDNLPASTKTNDAIAWLEKCRDGTVM